MCDDADAMRCGCECRVRVHDQIRKKKIWVRKRLTTRKSKQRQKKVDLRPGSKQSAQLSNALRAHHVNLTRVLQQRPYRLGGQRQRQAPFINTFLRGHQSRRWRRRGTHRTSQCAPAPYRPGIRRRRTSRALAPTIDNPPGRRTRRRRFAVELCLGGLFDIRQARWTQVGRRRRRLREREWERWGVWLWGGSRRRG